MKPIKASKPMGRPRAFDAGKALDRATQVFWRKGYQGTSLSDLTRAMGINRPSLYAAFGDKQALFHKVLERYSEGPASYLHQALQEPSARAVAERVLYNAADLLTNPDNPRGCLTVQAALACGKAAEPIRRELISWRAAAETAILERLRRAKAEGDLPADSDPAALAAYLSTVNQGMAVAAASGANRKELRQTASIALQAWPK